jgi:hypothetical protein
VEQQQQQVDPTKVIESLSRQVSEYAQKVALLEAYIAQIQPVQGNEKGD